MSSATVAAESTRPALDNLDAIIGLLSGAALAEQEKDSVDSLKALEAASRALAAHVASRKSVETREFLAIERQIFILTRQAYTVSGFTRIRPGNCAKVNDALEAAINANAHLSAAISRPCSKPSRRLRFAPIRVNISGPCCCMAE